MSVQSFHFDTEPIRLASQTNLAENDYKELRQAIGRAQIILIGEETHGTEEFYRTRAEITKALIKHEPGKWIVLCECDFPPFYHLNRYIGAIKPGADPVQTAEEAMKGLKHRYPVWMWHNECLRDFLHWCKAENSAKANTVAILGLDIYSLFWSAEEVQVYLNKVDPKLAREARKLYSSILSFRPKSSDYIRSLMVGNVQSQAGNLAQVLAMLLEKEMALTFREDDGDAFFSAVENARVVGAAEEYYRSNLQAGPESWNVRDTAMVKMIQHAIQWQEKRVVGGGRARVVVWAHNSHLGDASKTQHALEGQVNVGQLVRKVFGVENTFIVGQGTFTGTVRASQKWDGPDFSTDVLPSLANSTGHVLHQVAQSLGVSQFGVVFRRNDGVPLTPAQQRTVTFFSQPLLERFIGVQYIKKTERQSHYVMCSLSSQYDAFLHIDTTSALKPLQLPVVVNPMGPSRSKWDNFQPDMSDAEEDED